MWLLCYHFSRNSLIIQRPSQRWSDSPLKEAFKRHMDHARLKRGLYVYPVKRVERKPVKSPCAQVATAYKETTEMEGSRGKDLKFVLYTRGFTGPQSKVWSYWSHTIASSGINDRYKSAVLILVWSSDVIPNKTSGHPCLKRRTLPIIKVCPNVYNKDQFERETISVAW